METDLKFYKERLKERREELVAEIESAKESTKPVELDQASVGRLSRMDAMQAQEMALALERRKKEELVRIGSAMKRIETEEYGYCIDCEEPIAPKRLEFLLTVLTCVECAAKRE
ncbi:MAG: TraR/DksA family transcriptional regulator [Proteobacteria bacterium]|nr:TraR/DksA family transcriptional regulator [Pseudomonadota bacterium]